MTDPHGPDPTREEPSPFVSRLAAEDRCHLNGLALDEGRPRYVTAAAACDVADGWRDRRRDGGCVLEVPSGRTAAAGLSMPHSPRIYRGRLWLLNSGLGTLGEVDPGRGTFTPLAFCPGYLRGLAFAGDYAVVGLSRPRRDKTFGGLGLDEELARRGAEPRCGLHVIDLRSGATAHWLRLEGMVSELYHVVALPGVTRPMALGFKSEEIQHTLALDDEQALGPEAAGPAQRPGGGGRVRGGCRAAPTRPSIGMTRADQRSRPRS
jgi:uncharacterized protein (TIGR03032 family)